MADIYSSGDASWTGGSNVNDVYLIHSPLANETFVELTRSNLPYNVRLSAFHQALQGLAHFHLHGIMHRDIKPANLMVVSHNPMHAIIIDYGNATFEETSNDHGCGTIPYLAPEVMELKRCGGVGKPYNCLVDIWGLGLSAYQLFFQAACEWPDGMTRNVFAHISEKLQASSGISQILEIMLGWEAKDRPSSEHLLSLPIWREVSLPPQVQSSQGSLHAVSNKRSRP